MCVDNAQLPYLEVYNALFVLECIASNRVLISMCPINIIVQPKDVYSNTPRKHL